MISFIMPAKNASLYVSDAISALQKANYQDWELIAIDDHSTDNTYDILNKAGETDSRIKVFRNKGHGKIVGLNHGYTLTLGEIIKCIDADDVLNSNLFNYLGIMANCDATCHNAYITDRNLRIIGNYSVNKSIIGKNFIYCLKYLKSLPRWNWLFNRSLGNKIFPIPESLPFEDVWFSLIIKRYAKKISYVNESLYFYRQHQNQTYGGILNFDKKIVQFRARRILKLIEVFKQESERVGYDFRTDDLLDDVKKFNELLALDTLSWRDIMVSDMCIKLKFKALIYRKMYFIAPFVLRFKWWFDNFYTKANSTDS